MIPAVTAVRMSGARHRADLPLLVLGPSLGTSAGTLWSACAAHLTDHFDVLAWDLPGHGHNRSVPDEPFTAAELAQGVLRVVDDVCAERGGSQFHYAGDSVGGVVGLHLLLDAPERVSSAVLLCTGALVGTPESWADRIAQVRAGGTTALRESSTQRWFGPGFAEREPDRAEALLRALDDVADEGYVRVCEAVAGHDVRERLAAVVAPVLAVAGAHDVATPPEKLREIADGVPTGGYVELPGVAHLAPAEAPEEVARLIREHALGGTARRAPHRAPEVRRSRDGQDCFVYAAARTPFGRFGGALAGVRPDDLAAAALRAVLDKAPDLDDALVEEVAWGCANQAGEDNRNVGRMAVLLAGLPVSVPATTVNRLCGSSLDAAMVASRTVETGDALVVVAGGVESMTRAPWVLPKPSRAYPAGNAQLVSTTLGWRLVNERMPAEWTASLGECNEQLATAYAISRERQDAFAARSHQQAHAAWEAGFYDDLVVPVGELTRDEGIRAGSTVETLAGLKPSFRTDGTITPGNASPLNDGASAVLLGSEGAADRVGLAPLARIAGRGAAALEPQQFGIAPVEAADRALARAGITWADVAAVELNEAFAVQSLACLDAWEVDPAIVNAKGGAIAIGHPLGASGGRILGTLAHRLRESGDRWGVAAICIGVGQGLAVVLENVG